MPNMKVHYIDVYKDTQRSDSALIVFFDEDEQPVGPPMEVSFN